MINTERDRLFYHRCFSESLSENDLPKISLGQSKANCFNVFLIFREKRQNCKQKGKRGENEVMQRTLKTLRERHLVPENVVMSSSLDVQ